MGRIIGDVNNKLTWAEEKIVGFLEANKGDQFSAEEIQFFTDVRSDLVGDVMDNLRWKGYNVGSRGDEHWYIHNTWLAYVIGGSIVAAIMLIGFIAVYG